MEQEIFTGDGRESLAHMLQRVCNVPEGVTELLVANVMAINTVQQASAGYVPEWWINWQPGETKVELYASAGKCEVNILRRW